MLRHRVRTGSCRHRWASSVRARPSPDCPNRTSRVESPARPPRRPPREQFKPGSERARFDGVVPLVGFKRLYLGAIVPVRLMKRRGGSACWSLSAATLECSSSKRTGTSGTSASSSPCTQARVVTALRQLSTSSTARTHCRHDNCSASVHRLRPSASRASLWNGGLARGPLLHGCGAWQGAPANWGAETWQQLLERADGTTCAERRMTI